MNTAVALEKIIADYTPQLGALSAEAAAGKPSPVKWSKKEMLGHLIDSAQNNIRRFIVAQYEDSPTIIYAQDAWVTINNYQAQSLPDLIQLWQLLNKQIVAVLNATPSEKLQRLCKTDNPYTIEWLAQDYVKHLLHHLHQILERPPVAYP